MAGKSGMLLIVAMGGLMISLLMSGVLVWMNWDYISSALGFNTTTPGGGQQGSGMPAYEPPVKMDDIAEPTCDKQRCGNYLMSKVNSSINFDSADASDCGGCEQRKGISSNDGYWVNKKAGGVWCQDKNGEVGVVGVDGKDTNEVRTAQLKYLHLDSGSCSYDTNLLKTAKGKKNTRDGCRSAFYNWMKNILDTDKDRGKWESGDLKTTDACNGLVCGWRLDGVKPLKEACSGCWRGDSAGYYMWRDANWQFQKHNANGERENDWIAWHDYDDGNRTWDWANWYTKDMPETCDGAVFAAGAGRKLKKTAQSPKKPVAKPLNKKPRNQRRPAPGSQPRKR